MEEEVYRLLFRFYPLLFFFSDLGGPENRSMQSKHFKSLISCFLNIQTPFCGQELAFPTGLKREFAFYFILFSGQAVQGLHTSVSHTKRAIQWVLWGWWACLAGADPHSRVESFGQHSDIFFLLFTKAEKNLTHFEPCNWFSALEATHKHF